MQPAICGLHLGSHHVLRPLSRCGMCLFRRGLWCQSSLVPRKGSLLVHNTDAIARAQNCTGGKMRTLSNNETRQLFTYGLCPICGVARRWDPSAGGLDCACGFRVSHATGLMLWGSANALDSRRLKCSIDRAGVLVVEVLCEVGHAWEGDVCAVCGEEWIGCGSHKFDALEDGRRCDECGLFAAEPVAMISAWYKLEVWGRPFRVEVCGATDGPVSVHVWDQGRWPDLTLVASIDGLRLNHPFSSGGLTRATWLDVDRAIDAYTRGALANVEASGGG